MTDEAAGQSVELSVSRPPFLSTPLPYILFGCLLSFAAPFFPGYALLLFLGSLLASGVIILALRPARSIQVWAATIGLQLRSPYLPMPRLGIADVVILPVIARLFVTGKE